MLQSHDFLDLQFRMPTTSNFQRTQDGMVHAPTPQAEGNECRNFMTLIKVFLLKCFANVFVVAKTV